MPRSTRVRAHSRRNAPRVREHVRAVRVDPREDLVIRRHPRFGSVVDEHDRVGRAAVARWLRTGEEIGRWEDDEYVFIIAPFDVGAVPSSGQQAQKIIVRKDRPGEPVASGFWMDWPEDSWKVSEAEYARWPLRRRAEREAREQVERYVRKDYEREWLEFYHPAESDAIWFDKGWTDHAIKEKERRQIMLARELMRGGE